MDSAKSSYKNLTCFNKAADQNFYGHTAITRSALCRSSVSYWWTSNSKKSINFKKTSRKHRYCVVVKLRILCETASNRMASIFFTQKAMPPGACKQKIGAFYWINDFLYFFERGMQWTRKIKTVMWSNGTAKWLKSCDNLLLFFLIMWQLFLQNGIRNSILCPTVVSL